MEQEVFVFMFRYATDEERESGDLVRRAKAIAEKENRNE